MTDVSGVTYTWDNNGNLLNDGVNTYTYDSANRLKTLTGASTTASYAYNGLGDRLQETVNGNTTTFTMDLNTGLTQALSDGTNTYVYGLGRIVQTHDTTTEYFLGDALGSVRQLTSANGSITYASAYDPYGVVTQTSGASQTAYGYTNEYTSQGLIYLRSRMYSPDYGRFLTKDTWQGDYGRPLSLNQWNYVEGNPVNFIDPSGRSPENILSQGTSLYFNSVSNVNILNLIYYCNPVSGSLFGDNNKRYDLTGYLALAMTKHGQDARVKNIAKLIDAQDYSGTGSDYLAQFIDAYWKFNDLEGSNKVWDIKVKIQADLGDGIVLCGAQCKWFDYSTAGNIHFGYVAYYAKIDQGIAAVAGGVLEQGDLILKEHQLPNLGYCLQNASIFFCDNPGDQAAVDFGYHLAENHPNGITEAVLRTELTLAEMLSFQRPPSTFIEPHPPYPQTNAFGADHFNN